MPLEGPPAFGERGEIISGRAPGFVATARHATDDVSSILLRPDLGYHRLQKAAKGVLREEPGVGLILLHVLPQGTDSGRIRPVAVRISLRQCPFVEELVKVSDLRPLRAYDLLKQRLGLDGAP